MYKIITVKVSYLTANSHHNHNTALLRLQQLDITTIVIWGGTQA